MRITSISRLAVVAALAAAALTGCATAAGDPQTPVATASDSITIQDAWAKSADSGMSAAFGVLVNDGDADVTVVSASSSASTMIELHETVENDSGEMVMREVEGGFVIPAGGTFPLEPGGNHIMFMDVTEPLVAGAEVEITFTFDDGSTFTFTAPVKDYSGANENYEGDMDMDMEGDH
jgi:copper(I)-binding protein